MLSRPRPVRADGDRALEQQTTAKQNTPQDFRSTAVAPKTEVDRRRVGLIVGLLATAAIVTGIVLFALSRTSDRPAVAKEPADAAVVAQAPADLPALAPAPALSPTPTPTPTPTPASPRAKQPASPPVKTQAGPTIVGGGSAADHGVHIGSNVQIGSNVIIGSNTPAPAQTAPASKTKITKPADYNPKRFDPVAYLPKAQALAQQLIADAKLTNFEFDPVFPDGHVDLTMDGRDREYNFRSPSKSARPPDVPRNVPVERACMVHVEVGASEITATVRTTEDCDDKLVRAPKCSFGSVWKQALAAGTPKDYVARIGWLFDEQWFFDVDFEGKGGGVSSFADRCP